MFFISFSFIRVNAQQATVTLDRDQILLGEQVTLQLKLDNVAGEAQTVTQWFNVPDTGNHIEVIHRDKIDTVTIDGRSTFIQKIIITSFDSGLWTIPVIPPLIKDNNDVSRSITIDSVSLQVMPVDVSKMKDFHPVKDIMRVKYTDYTWLYITLGVLILALIIFLTVHWLKRRKAAPIKENPRIKGSPLDWALQQIDLLEKENLIEKGEGKLFFSKLDDICRTYFDERTQAHTLQSTSIEMMEKLRSYLIREKDRIALQQFTKLSDSVKFAKYQPLEQQAKDAIATAKETIRNIEKEVTDRKQKNAD
ncbi:hypothetical protein [Arachidicoccus ginsenosidimutans]|uniref:hypothetical protein n=1 Tax=Arachidicoccus sp. BS20 TaxID=1850526 RepID=UPI0012E6F67E|nr:hypothetical protein [Arachidicoccus sp. BS20]